MQHSVRQPDDAMRWSDLIESLVEEVQQKYFMKMLKKGLKHLKIMSAGAETNIMQWCSFDEICDMFAAVVNFMNIFAAKARIMQQCLFNGFCNTFYDMFAVKVEIMQ